MGTAAELIPHSRTLGALRQAAAGCTACDLYKCGTQTVFGDGEPRAKRRIHKKPNALEVAACRPWLDAEIEAVEPEVVVCLGATAAQALLGRTFRITKQRGEFFDGVLGRTVTATVHPSSILRAPDKDAREREFGAFVADLRRVARRLS